MEKFPYKFHILSHDIVEPDKILCPKILSVDEVIHSEHVVSQNQIGFIEIDGRKLAIPRIPIKEKGKIQNINIRAAPDLGEHNDSENRGGQKD